MACKNRLQESLQLQIYVVCRYRTVDLDCLVVVHRDRPAAASFFPRDRGPWETAVAKQIVIRSNNFELLGGSIRRRRLELEYIILYIIIYLVVY